MNTKRTVIRLLLFALSAPLFADDRPWRVGVVKVEHGYAASVAYVPRPLWEIEACVADQSFMKAVSYSDNVPGHGQVSVLVFGRYRVHPVDLFVTRRFLTGARLSPYVRLGARHVNEPPASGAVIIPQTSPENGRLLIPRVNKVFGLTDRDSAEAGAGAQLRLTPRTALRVDLTRLLRNKGVQFDRLTRLTAGLTWKF